MDKSKVKDYIKYFSNLMDKKPEDVTRQRLKGTKSDGAIRRKKPKSKVIYYSVLTTVRVHGILKGLRSPCTTSFSNNFQLETKTSFTKRNFCIWFPFRKLFLKNCSFKPIRYLNKSVLLRRKQRVQPSKHLPYSHDQRSTS